MNDATANYEYWQRDGGTWVEEYRRRRATNAIYGLQEVLLASIIDANVPGRILEFGCGVGRHLSYLSTIPGAEIHGVDQSPTMLAGVPQFVENLTTVGRVNLVEPLGRLPHDQRAFDIVYTAEVLIHVRPQDLHGRLAELVRVCAGSLFHLEPPSDYVLSADAHNGCWYHDLVAAYERLGFVARRVGRPFDAQELVTVDLDPSRPLNVPGAAVLQHMRNVEQILQKGIQHGGMADSPGLMSAQPGAAAVSKLQRSSHDMTVSDAYFSSQQLEGPMSRTLSEVDIRYGAPFGPVPASARILPNRLEVCIPVAEEEELKRAASFRAPFEIKGYPQSYMYDIVRAFRTIRGCKTYLEIGTFDRGNLAYTAQLLSDDALLIGLDIQADEERDELLRSYLKPGQTYVSVIGDSREQETVKTVAHILSGRMLDAAFIDGGHTAHAVMCDYVNYGAFVGQGGLIMFHDSLWEGNATFKGSADALAEIDRFDPIYLIPGSGAPHRFIRPMWRDEIWGIVGVHVK